mgnify:CR=1 FL=1
MSLVKPAQRIKTWEVTQDVTAYPGASFAEWPAMVQDKILAAMDRLARRVELPLAVVHSSAGVDHGDAADGSDDRFFIHVVVSEVVVEPDVDKMRHDMILNALVKPHNGVIQ